MDVSQLAVEHRLDLKRFQIEIDGQMAMVKYYPGNKEIIFTHTEVPEAFEGQGVAGKIAKTALEYAKAEGLRVRPMCPYIAAYIQRHPEYQPITVGY